jgi:hypothetical protein
MSSRHASRNLIQRFRARLTVERLEDRFLPSANLFDPFPAIADLFATDAALKNEPSPAHASGDLNAPFPHVQSAIATSDLNQTGPTTSPASQGPGTNPTNQGSSVDPQFLAAFQARPPVGVAPSPTGSPDLGGPHGKNSPLHLGGSVDLTGPSSVPVNADNDNGSAVTNGIPTQRDFNVSPLTKADPDLLQATITAAGVAGGGTWQENLTQNGKGKISLWTDAKKSATFTTPPAGNGSTTFYIEGTHESAAAGDVTLWFVYTVNNVSYPSATLTITVTPLIEEFTVSPG